MITLQEEKKLQYTIKRNEQFNSTEVYFTAKPTEETRNALKENHYRWHKAKGCWYGYLSEDDLRAILDGKVTTAKTTKKQPKEKKNKFGVKVGDYFSASWGYDQTQVDYFQVIALVGETSVRVREVYPTMIEETPTCSMAADRTYRLDTSKILPPASYSVFIKDQEKGDLKRLRPQYGDSSKPAFYLSSFCDAYYCPNQTEKVYESWYR